MDRPAIPRRGRPRREDAPGPTRADIAAAVVRLAEENQSPEINMRDVAAALGVSPRLIYRHVASKDELLRLAGASIAQMWEAPPQDAPWPERLTVIVRGARALARRFPALAEPLLLRNLATLDSPEVARIGTAVKDCFIEAGLPPKEAESLLFLYESLILGELTMWKASRTEAVPSGHMPTQETIDVGFDASLRYLIAGVLAQGDGRGR